MIPSLYKEECAKEYFYGRKEETFIEKTGNTEEGKGGKWVNIETSEKK